MKACLLVHHPLQHLVSSPMGSQTNAGKPAPSPWTNQKTFLDDVIMTFRSPMAWLLVVALIITWSAVAIVLFDLLDYKTLTGLPPPPAVTERGLKARGQESTDWLEMIWTFATSLIAPDDEEEGIHHLTDTLTSFHSEEH
ncbi:triadin isoform X7 [Channa argus]|uniref:triadin isoform X7 n=1 Tax=Channa argus TaxID=215402 RepID=UPI003520E332